MVAAKWTGSSLGQFLDLFIQKLNFCDFAIIWESLMERLKILAKGVQRVFEPSLRNLPPRLPISVALLVLSFFNISRIDTKLAF